MPGHFPGILFYMINNKFKYETARSFKKIVKFSNIILKNNLHINGLMKTWAKESQLGYVKAVTIVTYENVPIAAGIRYCPPEGSPYVFNTGIYVRFKYRRNGIGSNILRRLRLPNINYIVGNGNWASVPFFIKNKSKNEQLTFDIN